jgi:hypothetical protein
MNDIVYNMTINHGDVVELVDTLVLGTSAVRREGSSPFIPTKEKESALPGSFSLHELQDLMKNEQSCQRRICRNQKTSPFIPFYYGNV